MKKIIAFAISISIFCIFLLQMISSQLNYIHSNYADSLGDNLSEEKYKSMVLQNQGINKADDLNIFGSSELDIKGHPYHASTFFQNKRDGFQMNIIGRAGYKCLVHAIDFGALGSNLKGKKSSVRFVTSMVY